MEEYLIDTVCLSSQRSEGGFFVSPTLSNQILPMSAPVGLA
jgi:hypothetical protein